MIADFKPYHAMKDSGLPWLREVPEHWEVRRLKQICRLAYGDALAADVREHGAVPVFGSNGRVGFHSSANTKAPCIVIGRKGSFGKVNFSVEPAFAIDTTFFIDDRFSAADVRWLFYLLGWLRLDEVSKDSAVPGLDREDAYQRVAAVPPLPEQTAIVRFLDHADRRIRRYIRAKQKLIKLLEEQKQAIIHRAVTRGLDPNVRLKPSGVEWLGDVPEHWEVLRFKFVAAKIVDCLHATPKYSESGEFPAIRTADISPGTVHLSSARRIESHEYARWVERLEPKPGDILYSREGERFGIAACVPDGTRLCISQRMMVFRVRPEYDPVFVMWLLNSKQVYAQACQDVMGATAPHVNVSTIRNYFLSLPARDEQDSVVAEIEKSTRGFSDAIAKAASEISLLREYRTRLIADVVTGKLDVREAAARLPEETEAPETLDEIGDDETQEGESGNDLEEAMTLDAGD
jgi:type I restriction enzyme, S subunit